MKNSEKLIEQIKKDQLAPVPKWYFHWKRGISWFIYLSFILIGAISFSVILFTIQQSEFNLMKHLGHSSIEFILVFLPILWLILLIIFLIASILSAKNSDRGYKLSFNKWIALSTGLSMVLGTLFFIAGGAQYFEESFANQFELYQSVNEKKIKIWSQPENGNLSGQIIDVQENFILIKDFNNMEWKIDYDDQTIIANRILLEVGEQIKLNGQLIHDQTFEASHIRPWGMGSNQIQHRGDKKNKNSEK